MSDTSTDPTTLSLRWAASSGLARVQAYNPDSPATSVMPDVQVPPLAASMTGGVVTAPAVLGHSSITLVFRPTKGAEPGADDLEFACEVIPERDDTEKPKLITVGMVLLEVRGAMFRACETVALDDGHPLLEQIVFTHAAPQPREVLPHSDLHVPPTACSL
ncbi:hypothetical protein C8Q80DRAFT_1116921 [Daedaleopsis nitida]|nr:hypothetical protein C8Q80DRAFT_1116921 [Daedaleopsis nitida]